MIFFLSQCAGPAYASGGEVDFSSLLFPVLNFGIFVTLIVFLYRKFGAPMVRARSREIADRIGRSARELSAAQEESLELDRRLSNIEQEQSEVVRQFELEGGRIAKKLMEDAYAAARAHRSEVARRIQGEFDEAVKEVRLEVIEYATALVRKQLLQELSEEEDRRLRQQVMRGLLT